MHGYPAVARCFAAALAGGPAITGYPYALAFTGAELALAQVQTFRHAIAGCIRLERWCYAKPGVRNCSTPAVIGIRRSSPRW